MKNSASDNVPSNGSVRTSKTAKVAALSCLLAIASMCNTAVAQNNKSNDGCAFGRWFWDMIDCINDEDKFDTKYMLEKGYDYYYPEIPDFDVLAESIVKSMDKNGDNEIDLKEFSDKGVEILQKQAGVVYNIVQKERLQDNLLAPLFRGLDYIGSATDRTNGTNTLNKKEIAGNLYALSKKNLKTGHFSGDAITEEFISIMTEGHPTGQFKTHRESYKNQKGNR